MAETEILKKKKKKWYGILASPEFNNIEIGETLADSEESLIGRSLEVNLANITNDPKSQNIKIKFKINQVKGNEAYTEVYRYELSSTYIKRVVKPTKNKVDDSILFATKDNIKIRIKPLFLTKALVKKSILTMLRIKSREYLQNYFKENEYKKLIQDLVSHNIQKDLKNILKKIYPLNTAEIRLMQRL